MESEITCPRCGTANAATRLYCKRCGSKIRKGAIEMGIDACPRCEGPRDFTDDYCGRCGLDLPPATQTELIVPSMQKSAERRQLTVMFADLVDSTRMSAAMDPEDMRELNAAYQRTVADTITRYDGFVGRYMGDGVLAYFGYPRAHGDDPERAVLAGREIVDAVTSLSQGIGKSKGVEMHVRVGIATGLVVVGDLIGDGAASERAVVGDTPNLAARLQGLAEPDSVLVSESTRRRLGPRFRLESLGARELKGFELPVQAFRAVGYARDGQSAHVAHTSTVVGRERELRMLLEQWKRVEEGTCRRVVISGPAGMGKTTLVEALLERLQERPHTQIRWRASPFHQRSAFHAVAEWLSRHAGFADGDDEEAKRTKVAHLLGECELEAQLLEPIAKVLALSGDAPSSTERTGEESERLLDAVSRVIVGVAHGKPILLVAENVQWMDHSTRALVEHVVHTKGSVAMVIVTHRPDVSETWVEDEKTIVMPLERISDPAIVQLIREISGGRTMPPEITKAIVERSGGVPLFAEELTRSMFEQGWVIEEGGDLRKVGTLPEVAIPATLQESIMARLDRLGSDKTIVQIAATIGQQVPRALLGAVARLPEAETDAAIVRLLRAGILTTEDGETLVFRQALVQETAYESLLRTRRRQLHARIAELLPDVNPDLVESAPERLAHHHAEAGQHAQAIELWRTAAALAAHRYAVSDSIAHLESALECFAEIGRSDATVDDELRVRLRIIELARINAAIELARRHLVEAEAVASEHGRLELLSEIHHEHGNLCFMVGDIDGCVEQHERSRSIAREIGSAAREAAALGGLGDAHYFRGEMATAYARFSECVQLCREHGLEWVEAANRHMLAWCSVWLLRMDEALEHATQGVALAQRIGHVRAEMIANGAYGFVQGERGDAEAGLRAAERSADMARKLGSVPFEASMGAQAGRLSLRMGRIEEARERAQRALAAARKRPEALRFAGPIVLSFAALTTQDSEQAQRMIQEGERLLESPVVGHNHFWFRDRAMQVALRDQNWDEVERHAQALEAYTRKEPVPWCELHVARARALARYGREGLTDEVRSELENVAARLRETGLPFTLREVEAALAKG